MPRYTVKARYFAERSDRDLTAFGPWEPGAEVELEEADAEWINRDAGSEILVPAKEKAAAKKAPAKEKAAEHGTAHSTADSGLTKG